MACSQNVLYRRLHFIYKAKIAHVGIIKVSIGFNFYFICGIHYSIGSNRDAQISGQFQTQPGNASSLPCACAPSQYSMTCGPDSTTLTNLICGAFQGHLSAGCARAQFSKIYISSSLSIQTCQQYFRTTSRKGVVVIPKADSRQRTSFA